MTEDRGPAEFEEEYEPSLYPEESTAVDAEGYSVVFPAEEPAERSPEEAELAARIAARKKLRKRRQIRKKSLVLIGMILIFALLITMCGREIIRLKAENYALRKQQQELEEQRDALKEELKNVGDKDYIKEQARKQLRLLDPGEIMFIFDED